MFPKCVSSIYLNNRLRNDQVLSNAYTPFGKIIQTIAIAPFSKRSVVTNIGFLVSASTSSTLLSTNFVNSWFAIRLQFARHLQVIILLHFQKGRKGGPDQPTSRYQPSNSWRNPSRLSPSTSKKLSRSLSRARRYRLPHLDHKENNNCLGVW